MLDIDVKDLRRRLQGDAEFARAARHWTGSFGFATEDVGLRVLVEAGRVREVLCEKDAPAAEVKITGPADGWANVFAAVPPPYFQDLVGGAVGRHGFTISGDLLVLSAYYGAIQRAAVLAGRSLRKEAV